MARKSFLLLILLLLSACSPAVPSMTPTTAANPLRPAMTFSLNATPPPSALTPTQQVAAAISSSNQPSYRVAAFYYPWYGTPQLDDQWVHWGQNGHLPPQDIASDYYPALGPYSSNDPAVLDQHMLWLEQAGIGVIIVSWWGRGSREDQVVPAILAAAARHGIKVAFHIEPYDTRTADDLVQDVIYLYQNYGASPAFFTSTATSRFSTSAEPKGMFFVWCIQSPGACGQGKVGADYWRPALDAIHSLPQGALVIANITDGSWVSGGHFDGLYNYATLHPDQDGGFAWARTLPPGSLYIPSVIPGFSASRVGYVPDTFVARNDGQTYNDQWAAALNTGVQPALMTITSFNEWHEGSMIEPIALGKNDGSGYNYADFGSLPPDGYLNLTHQWIGRFVRAAAPVTYRARLQIKTTSDWTTLKVVSGGQWLQPEMVSASQSATRAGFESGDRFVLMQSLTDAKAGAQVEMTWDLQFAGLSSGIPISFQIDRGDIGSTEVTVSGDSGSDPATAAVFTWAGVTGGRNSELVSLPSDRLINPAP